MRDRGHTGDPRPRPNPAAPVAVTGTIVITGGVAPLAGAVAHVHLEDVSDANAPAQAVAEAIIAGLQHPPAGGARATVIAFALNVPADAPPIDPARFYAVRVWIDRDGDGRPGPGDLYSDQSYRVLTRGFGRSTTITFGPTAGEVHAGEHDEQR